MNDLLAPILYVMDNEVEAFWCFNQWMKSMHSNFRRDQSGMRTKLRQLELLVKVVDPYLYSHLGTFYPFPESSLLESCDSTNLFCCFRWLLIALKREFEFDDILILWEKIWACSLTNHFDVFIAFAILNKHREEIMATCTAFDEVLKVCLSGGE